MNLTIYDPWANPDIARKEYNIDIDNYLSNSRYDGVILTVSHDIFSNINFNSLVNINHVVFDVKGFIDNDIVDSRL